MRYTIWRHPVEFSYTTTILSKVYSRSRLYIVNVRVYILYAICIRKYVDKIPDYALSLSRSYVLVLSSDLRIDMLS